jgi:hypothetical protein
MPPITTEKYQKAIPNFIEDEGHVKFEIAPLTRVPTDLPSAWRDIFISDDPVWRVLEDLWLPWDDLLPETIAQLKEKLRCIGLLQTDEFPFSLIYGFEDDGEAVFRRGYPCRPIDRDEAKKLPDEFLSLYNIHDGWTDMTGYTGPLPNDDWFSLSDIYGGEYSENIPGIRLRDFLVICDTGGFGYLGFDLSKKPPLGLVCAVGEAVEVSPDVVRTLDEWMAFELGNLT